MCIYQLTYECINVCIEIVDGIKDKIFDRDRYQKEKVVRKERRDKLKLSRRAEEEKNIHTKQEVCFSALLIRD